MQHGTSPWGAPTCEGDVSEQSTCPGGTGCTECHQSKDFKHGRSNFCDGVRQKHKWTQTSLIFCGDPLLQEPACHLLPEKSPLGIAMLFTMRLPPRTQILIKAQRERASRREKHRTNLPSGSAQRIKAARASWAGRDPNSAPSPVPGQPFVLRMSCLLPRPFGIVYEWRRCVWDPVAGTS